MDFLVIDDDKTFRDATCFLIEDEGHYAEGVDSGQMGMNWLKDEQYDAVLLDMNLGAESGLDILTQIQKQNPQIPVVIITALEGAIILARVRRDLTPFDALVGEFGPLLDAVAQSAPEPS